MIAAPMIIAGVLLLVLAYRRAGDGAAAGAATEA